VVKFFVANFLSLAFLLKIVQIWLSHHFLKQIANTSIPNSLVQHPLSSLQKHQILPTQKKSNLSNCMKFLFLYLAAPITPTTTLCNTCKTSAFTPSIFSRIRSLKKFIIYTFQDHQQLISGLKDHCLCVVTIVSSFNSRNCNKSIDSIFFFFSRPNGSPQNTKVA
jgi:hypothetical protein